MAKRIAAKELNHDNWADEEEPEEMGTFNQASSEQLVVRQIKKARRRGVAGNTSSQSVFKGFTSFTGFGVNKDSTSQPSFSFLSKNSNETAAKPSFDFSSMPSTNTNSITKPETNSCESKTTTQPFKFTQDTASTDQKTDSSNTNGVEPTKAISDSTGKGGSKIFLAHLKALNEGVLTWVKQHLDKNPHVNLSPVFDDYKKHFEELTRKYPPACGGESDSDAGASNNLKKDEASEKENKPLISVDICKESPSSNKLTSGPITAQTNAPTTEKSLEPNKMFFSSGSIATESEKKTETADATSAFTFGGFGTSSKKPETSIFGGSKNSIGLIFGDLSSSQSNSPSKGFTFGNGSSNTSEVAGSSVSKAEVDESSEEPPKVEVTEVKEDGALYEKKCKLFYMKDKEYVEKGVGTLFLKPAGDKTQLVVRALTNLGNILLNIILNATVPAMRAGKNGVIIACVPNPPLDGKSKSNEPVKMLIRVKTGEDADNLLQKINELKK